MILIGNVETTELFVEHFFNARNLNLYDDSQQPVPKLLRRKVVPKKPFNAVVPINYPAFLF
jgi:hypothetical protein